MYTSIARKDSRGKYCTNMAQNDDKTIRIWNQLKWFKTFNSLYKIIFPISFTLFILTFSTKEKN